MFRCIMGVRWRQHRAETARAWRGASEPAGVSKHHGRRARTATGHVMDVKQEQPQAARWEENHEKY